MKVHLDTDIGGDLDDLCALALLLRWPGAELTGVTTVLEEGGRRAGYARYALSLAGRAEVPVAAGADVSLGELRLPAGLPPEARYWPQPVPPAPGPLAAALDLLAQSIERGATVVGIGPFTNLALLERRSPATLRRATLCLMGGCVRPAPAGFPQWDFRQDYNTQAESAAALQVLEAADPARTTIVPIEVTVQTALRRADLPALRRGDALARLIARQAEVFAADERIAQRHGPGSPALPADIVNFHHDPLACATALDWEGVTVDSLSLSLELEEGWLRQREAPGAPPRRVVTAVDGARFNRLWRATVAGAAPLAPAGGPGVP